MTKVLLTTTLGPFKEQYFNTSPTEAGNQRFTRGSDIFTLCAHQHMMGPHLIAQGIDVPSVFLEYPQKEDFLKELEKGYDYVGITSFHNQVDDVIEMCKMIRAKAPKSEIVLGSYGAVGLDVTKTDEELEELCDHLCREEGITFFRKLLGEPLDKRTFHSHLPKCGYAMPMITENAKGNTPTIVGSLGCTNGCDFCGTTEYFNQKRHEMMSPWEVHKEFQRIYRENPYTPQVTILEEDSFQDIEYIQELGKLLREDSEFGLGYYSFNCLSSIRSLSEWTFDDIALTGCSSIFIGMESKFAPDHGYGKREGSARKMFKGLHDHGIATIGAWMIGFDFQDRQNIQEDLQEFIACEPTMQQLTQVCPFPGTPMWKQMKEEGRIREDVRWEEIGFYGGGGMTPKNFNDHEILNIIDRGYKELYETHGSNIARLMDVNMRGYEYCMENRHKNKYLGERSQLHKRLAFGAFPMLKAMEIYAPNGTVRKKMKGHRRKYMELFGEPTTFQKGAEKALTGLSGFTKFMDILYPRDNFFKEEPFKKYIYDKPAPAYPERPYRTEHPHRTLEYKVKAKATDSIMNLLRKTQTFTNLLDRRKGMDIDDNETDGALSIFS